MKKPHLNYLGYPIHQNAHYGNSTELREDKLTYLARTCQATFNIVAMLSPNFAVNWAWSMEGLRQAKPDLYPTLVESRSQYDSSFRRFYRNMEDQLKNGMTLREACLTLRPNALFEQLKTWKPKDTYLALVLKIAIALPESKQGVQDAEKTVQEESCTPSSNKIAINVFDFRKPPDKVNKPKKENQHNDPIDIHSTCTDRLNTDLETIEYPFAEKIVEVKTIETKGSHGDMLTSSLTPLHNDVDLTSWLTTTFINLERLNRHLLLNRDTGKIGWVRLTKSRITYFSDSIQKSDRITIAGHSWQIAYFAEWRDDALKNGNIRVRFKYYAYTDAAFLDATFWFTTSSLILTDLKTKGETTGNEQVAFEALRTAIEKNDPASFSLIVRGMLTPFKYKANLHGVHAFDFFGSATKVYKMRLGELFSQHILSIESLTT